ncbi:MAG: PEP-utilizing enzyme [Sporichthyaceae bacterium]
MSEFAQVGTGLTVFEYEGIVCGPVIWLDSPQAVLDFVRTGDVANTIVLARGGTTTFLVPALSAGVKGVMTLQGSPESHLGILSREYGIPALMSVAFTEGITSSRGETIPPDGATVRIDVSSSPNGHVWIGEADRDYGAAAAAGATAEDPEAAAMAAQLAQLMASYRGEIADGPRGDRQMRNRLRTGILDNDAANIARDLEPAEISDFLAYTGWNLWDLIKTRQTEGESGLIPRQEYETISFVQQWHTYAQYYEQITEKVGIDGVIAMGGIPRREFGTKSNHVHQWGTGVCPLLGKALSATMGVTTELDPVRNSNTMVSFYRRLQYGLWGEGPGFVSGRNYQVQVLDSELLTRFRDSEVRLAPDSAELSAFRAFNAASELAGFLVSYDCRAGLCDTGPYPLPDGGFILVRDHFLYDPAYEWAGVLAGMPYCVTQAMFFRPDTPVEIRINDIATTFSNPKNYLKYLSGAAVFARDTWDTPMSAVRQIDEAEMASIVARCNAGMLELYGQIAALPMDTRLRNGIKVYCRTMMLPWMRSAGIWGDTVPPEFDRYAPETEQLYPALAGGEAMQVLGGVFLMGVGLVPEAGLGTPPQVGPEAFASLHKLALRGMLTELAEAESLIDAELVESTPSGFLLSQRGRDRHAELLAADSAGLDVEKLAGIYDRFLALNTPMKALSAKAVSARGDDRLTMLGEFSELVERTAPVLRRTAELLPRFVGYQDRLTDALGKAEGAQWEYLTSPVVDSIHTVWMELHEDYLQTLNRDREAEGSY